MITILLRESGHIDNTIFLSSIIQSRCNNSTVFLRFTALGYFLIFEVFGGALNLARTLTRTGVLIKTCQIRDLPFSDLIPILLVTYDN